MFSAMDKADEVLVVDGIDVEDRKVLKERIESKIGALEATLDSSLRWHYDDRESHKITVLRATCSYLDGAIDFSELEETLKSHELFSKSMSPKSKTRHLVEEAIKLVEKDNGYIDKIEKVKDIAKGYSDFHFSI